MVNEIESARWAEVVLPPDNVKAQFGERTNPTRDTSTDASSSRVSVPQASREVALSEVVEQGHEPASTLAAGDALEAGHVRAGRLTHEEAGAGQADAHRVGLIGRDRHALVDQRLIEDGRHDVLGAAEGFEAFDAGEDFGDDRDDLDARVVLLQAAARAREGAAGPHPDDEMGETTAGLLEDLRRRRFIVRTPVVVVAVLVAKEIVIRVALPPPPDLTQGFVVAELRIGEHEPRSVGAEPLLALEAGVL